MNDNDTKTLSRQRFSKFAGRYVTSQAHAKGPGLKRLAAIADAQPNWMVLDVATGGGHTALRFAPEVRRVIAADLAPEMLMTARRFLSEQRLGNVAFAAADAEWLPFANEVFDLVTCRIAPHHFPNCARFVTEAARVLKTGGALLVQDHLLPEDGAAARYIDAFERLRDPSHHRAYAASEWEGMFREAGLEVVHAERIIKHHAFKPWAERQACTEETMDLLRAMAEEAPPSVVAWMRPQGFGTTEATFISHHIIIAGRVQM